MSEKKLFKGLFHICLFCNDIKKSVEFYEKLGFEVLFNLQEQEGDEPWDYYIKVAHGQYVELQPVHSDNPHPHPDDTKYYGNQTVWHFALETEDMKNMIEVLNARGIEVWQHPEPEAARVYSIDDIFLSSDGCYVCWIYDPDGTPIELMEQVGNTKQRQYDPE